MMKHTISQWDFLEGAVKELSKDEYLITDKPLKALTIFSQCQ